MPEIQGQEQITLRHLPGDEAGIEYPSWPPATHFDFTNRSQAGIGKEAAPGPRHAYQGKTRREKASQRAQRRKAQQVIANGIAKNHRRSLEAKERGNQRNLSPDLQPALDSLMVYLQGCHRRKLFSLERLFV
jgi:hypothetical protein